MSISSTFDRLHLQAKGNSWLWLFSIFCRVTLAFGFFAAGMVKILGERFASGLSANHPMGHFLEALSLTGYYYTFIGIAQIASALMLLVPRTATLGAFLYFPIILNICILTFATRFDGSMFTAPLMTLANLYLLGWNYEKWKAILPFNRPADDITERKEEAPIQDSANRRADVSRYGISSLYPRFRIFLEHLFSDKFPTLFFAGVFAAVLFFMLIVPRLYSVLPHNSYTQCLPQFKNSRRRAGENFCHCIHKNGEPLDKCLSDYKSAPNDIDQTP